MKIGTGLRCSVAHAGTVETIEAMGSLPIACTLSTVLRTNLTTQYRAVMTPRFEVLRQHRVVSVSQLRRL